MRHHLQAWMKPHPHSFLTCCYAISFQQLTHQHFLTTENHDSNLISTQILSILHQEINFWLLERDPSRIGFWLCILEIPFKWDFLVLPEITSFWKFPSNEIFLFFRKSRILEIPFNLDFLVLPEIAHSGNSLEMRSGLLVLPDSQHMRSSPEITPPDRLAEELSRSFCCALYVPHSCFILHGSPRTHFKISFKSEARNKLSLIRGIRP